jgi:hypothetical protein
MRTGAIVAQGNTSDPICREQPGIRDCVLDQLGPTVEIDLLKSDESVGHWQRLDAFESNA